MTNSNVMYKILTSSSTTFTLPSSPVDGQVVIFHYCGSSGTYSFSVTKASGATYTLPYQVSTVVYQNTISLARTFVYTSSTNAWTIATTKSDTYTQLGTASTLSVPLGNTNNNIALSSDGTYVCYGVYQGSIYYSTNNGTSFAVSNAPSTRWGQVVCSQGSSTIVFYAGPIDSSGTALYKSTTFGATWTSLSIPSQTQRNISALATNADGSVVAFCHYLGSIYVSTDGGSSWSTVSTFSGTEYVSMKMSFDGSRIFIAGNGSDIVLYSSDTGSSFTSFGSARGLPAQACMDVCMSDDGVYQYTAIYLNASYSLYRSENSGTSFTQVTDSTLPKSGVYRIVCSSSGMTVLCSYYNSTGTSAGLYVSQNYGTNWVLLSSGVAHVFSNYNLANIACINYARSSLQIGTVNNVQ